VLRYAATFSLPGRTSVEANLSQRAIELGSRTAARGHDSGRITENSLLVVHRMSVEETVTLRSPRSDVRR